MKKPSVVVLLVSALAAPTAFAKDACATILCLSSKADAKNTLMCNQPADDFFSIKKKTAGVFDPGKTLKARRDYIYGCEDAREEDKEFVLSAYGSIVKW